MATGFVSVETAYRDADFPPTFGWRLFRMVSNPEHASIVHWCADGRSFCIRNVARLEREVLGLYFASTSYPTLQNQLYMYSFEKDGRYRECRFYRHPFFLRWAPGLAARIPRKKQKSRQHRSYYPDRSSKAGSA